MVQPRVENPIPTGGPDHAGLSRTLSTLRRTGFLGCGRLPTLWESESHGATSMSELPESDRERLDAMFDVWPGSGRRVPVLWRNDVFR